MARGLSSWPGSYEGCPVKRLFRGWARKSDSTICFSTCLTANQKPALADDAPVGLWTTPVGDCQVARFPRGGLSTNPQAIGRTPPPKLARSILHRGEHGAGLDQAGASNQAVPRSVPPGRAMQRHTRPSLDDHSDHPGRPPIGSGQPACKLVCGGTIRFRTMMPHARGQVGRPGGVGPILTTACFSHSPVRLPTHPGWCQATARGSIRQATHAWISRFSPLLLRPVHTVAFAATGGVVVRAPAGNSPVCR
jgi:hypothetical protein